MQSQITILLTLPPELEEAIKKIDWIEATLKSGEKHPIEDTLLTKKELAKFLRVSLPTVTRLIREKKIKPIYTGLKMMFSKRNVLESLEDINKHYYSRRAKY
jgi:excisionase family DNA binding protein